MSQRRSLSAAKPPQLSCFPYGVGHGNEGICLLVKMGSHRILLDCGLADLKTLIKDKKKPPADFVICSHAHADHAQGLLALHRKFPKLPIYASQVTKDLLPLNWLEENTIPQFCQPLPWRVPISLAPNLTVELFPAGHLPGAAVILLRYQTATRTYKILYTGDFSVSNFQLVDGLSIEALRGLAPDVLIIEGSYGTMRHPHRRQQEKQLMERIEQAIASGKSVILPVPILGLGQEILKLLRSHHQFTGKDLDIWVDGNIAQACDLYLQLLTEFPAAVQNFAKHQPLFWDERICPRMRRLNPDNLPDFEQSPSIVVTDYTADLYQYCQPQSGSWLILVPEFPRLLVNSLQIPPLRQISVETYLLAEHSDGRNTTQLIHNLRPQHIIFVHSAPNYLADLTSLEELQNRYQLHSPAAGTLVELPIGDTFMQPAIPKPTQYEGEINEIGTSVMISLPDAIASDSRWHNFADTGLVEARWQGEELVLRGLSQRELLSHSPEGRMPIDLDCCATCRFQRDQRCSNPNSPLYGFKVTPEGYCPVFEPQSLDGEDFAR